MYTEIDIWYFIYVHFTQNKKKQTKTNLYFSIEFFFHKKTAKHK